MSEMVRLVPIPVCTSFLRNLMKCASKRAVKKEMNVEKKIEIKKEENLC
jgi:hypothetical protein